MKQKSKQILLNNKGVTGIDLVLSITILVIFSGTIIGIMSSIYKISQEIEKSANAMSYATIILEKVDEKSYEEVTSDFVTNLINNNEIKISDDYSVTFSVTPAGEENEDLVKKVNVNVTYNVNGKDKSIIINKLKIKEIYKDELL